MRRHRRIAETIRQFFARRRRRTFIVQLRRSRAVRTKRRRRRLVDFMVSAIRRGIKHEGPDLIRLIRLRMLEPEEYFERALWELRTLEQMTFWERLYWRLGFMLFRYDHRQGLFRYVLRRKLEKWRFHFTRKWPAKAVFHVTEYYRTVRELDVKERNPEIFDDTVRVVVDMAKARAKWETEVVPNEEYLRLFLQELVAYYKEEECKSNLIAVMITPVIYHYVKGQEGRFYISRWTPVMVLKPDPWIRRAMPIDTHFVTLAQEKPEEEWVSVRVYAGEGKAEDDTEVVTARDNAREPFLRGRVRDVIFRPYKVARDFARALGTPEKWIHMTHCSLYFMPTRSTEMSRRYRKRARVPRDYQLDHIVSRDYLAKFGRPKPVLIARRKGFT